MLLHFFCYAHKIFSSGGTIWVETGTFIERNRIKCPMPDKSFDTIMVDYFLQCQGPALTPYPLILSRIPLRIGFNLFYLRNKNFQWFSSLLCITGACPERYNMQSLATNTAEYILQLINSLFKITWWKKYLGIKYCCLGLKW